MNHINIFKTKAIAPYDEDYIWTLGDDDKAFVESELRETEDRRKHALAAMRDWLDRNPKILKGRYDSNFLLVFLRTRKFNILERFNRILNYRNGMLVKINLQDRNLQHLHNRGFIFPLPNRDQHGRHVFCVRFGAVDVNKNKLEDIFRATSLMGQLLLAKETAQIHGFGVIIDCSGVTLQHSTWANWTDVIEFTLM